MNPSNVFVSYARADVEFVRTLASRLQNSGIDIWVDILDIRPGKAWDTQVENALDKCQFLLFIASASSVESENVLDEVYSAIDDKKQVIPIRIMECKMPLRLKRLEYIDFTNQFDEKLQELVEILKSDNLETTKGDGRFHVTRPDKPHEIETWTRQPFIYPNPGIADHSGHSSGQAGTKPRNSKSLIIAIVAVALIAFAFTLMRPSDSYYPPTTVEYTPPMIDSIAVSTPTLSPDIDSDTTMPTNEMTPIEFSNQISEIFEELTAKGTAWDNELSNARQTQDFSVLKVYREAIQSCINTSIIKLEAMNDISNSSALRTAMIQYLGYEDRLISEYLVPFEELTNADDAEDLIINFQYSSASEEMELEKVKTEQEAYATANGFTIASK